TTFVSCRQTTSGEWRASSASSRSCRWRIEFTFQVTNRIVGHRISQCGLTGGPPPAEGVLDAVLALQCGAPGGQEILRAVRRACAAPLRALRCGGRAPLALLPPLRPGDLRRGPAP